MNIVVLNHVSLDGVMPASSSRPIDQLPDWPLIARGNGDSRCAGAAAIPPFTGIRAVACPLREKTPRT
jgi:hypothetical protein